MNRLSYILPFLVLLAMTCCNGEAERTRMCSGLDSLNRLNRSGQPFTPAGVQPYVDFFDRYGTANDRLLAHYLMGRAYHEQGEAPMALQCYQQAAECADTTASDCDYAQLSRVYGQMGDVFFDHNINDYQIQLYQNAVNYAMKAGDTITAMYNMEQICGVYEKTEQLDSAIAIIESICRWYMERGYLQDAAISYGRAATLYVECGDFKIAKKYMRVYEKESGLFDYNGDIEAGREIYYYYKGMLFLYENRYDSAEFYFQKELHIAKDYNNQNAAAKGLSMLYEKTKRNDLAVKYATYAYAMNDSAYEKMTTSTIGQMKALYDYTRHQELARKESERANHEKNMRQSVLVVLCILIIGVVGTGRFLIRKKKEQVRKYYQTLEELEKAQSEIMQLRLHESDYLQLIKEKEDIIEEKRKKLKTFFKAQSANRAEAERKLKQSIIYQELEKKAIRGTSFTESDWHQLHILIMDYLPGVNDFLIANHHLLNRKEYDTCLLLRLHFKPIDISNILHVSPAYISKICNNMMLKLYQDKGQAKDLSARLNEIF